MATSVSYDYFYGNNIWFSGALTFCIAEPSYISYYIRTKPIFVIPPQSSNANRSGNEDDPDNSDIIDNTIDNDDPNSEIDETSEDPGESNNDGQAVENLILMIIAFRPV